MENELVQNLGSFLSYGAIGLGLGLAVISGIILLSGTPSATRTRSASAFMIFGFAIFVVGAAIEIYKLYLENAKFERVLALSEQMPDQLWRDFLKAKEAEFFRDAKATGLNDEDTVDVGKLKSYSVDLRGGECVSYYAATPPPSEVIVDIRGDIQQQALTTKEYYKTGRICSINDAESVASFSVSVDGEKGSRSRLSFVTFELPSRGAQPLVQTAKVAGILCTGEFEERCTGAHSLFVPCGASVDDAVRASMCAGDFKLKSLSSVGGNKCGYGLIEVTCLASEPS